MMTNQFQRNNSKESGNTLLEVIVSIVLIGIIFVMVIRVFISSQKTNNNLVKSDQIITEVENVYTIFTNNPNLEDFKSKLGVYGYTFKYITEENKGYIYFTELFYKTSDTESMTYIYFEYSVSGEYAKLTTDVYVNGELQTGLQFSREVKL